MDPALEPYGHRTEASARFAPSSFRRLLAGFLILRLAVFLGLSSPGDVRLYHAYAEKGATGLAPYRDFPFEYPPLAYGYIALPRFLLRQGDFPSYHKLFRLQSHLADLGAFVFLVASKTIPERLLWAYLVSTTALGPVLYDRLDAGLALLFALAIYLRSRDRPTWAYAALGAAGALKLFGALLFPAMLAHDLRRRDRRSGAFTGAFFLGLVLPSLPIFLAVGWKALSFLEYHALRGLQVESAGATVAFALSRACGLAAQVAWNRGAHELRTALSPALSSLSSPLVALIALAPLPLGRRSRNEDPWIPLAATLSGILSASKVLSPQFFIFFLPVLLAAASRLHQGAAWASAAIALAALTTVGYPILYEQLLSLRAAAWLVVGARNLLLLATAAGLYRAWLGDRGSRGGSEGPQIGYMAPEALRHRGQVGPGVDIWGAGIVAYQALLGTPEFRKLYGAVEPVAWARWLLSREKFRTLDELSAPVSPGLSAIVEKMLEKDPRARYASIAEIRRDFERLAAPPAAEEGPSLASAVRRLLPSLLARPGRKP